MSDKETGDILQKSLCGKIMIAGPCSAETECQVMDTARSLAEAGVRIFRAGIWKPRTRPGCFEGIGVEGLAWLKRVKEETGMRVTTEIANPTHVEEALNAGIDILWIGARTTTSPFAIQEIADCMRGCDTPVMVKNPVNPDIELWNGAIERLEKAGINVIAAIHRGFSTYGEKTYRNAPQWQIPIELRRRRPDLPILCDPSHIGGDSRYILPLSQTAFEMNADGLFIEVHCSPGTALSDATQQITPKMYVHLLESLKSRRQPDNTESAGLSEFRTKIDECDRQLLSLIARRMDIVSHIGEYKQEHGLTILQSQRYTDIIEALQEDSETKGLSKEFIKSLFEIIHTESIRIQLDLQSSLKNEKL